MSKNPLRKHKVIVSRTNKNVIIQLFDTEKMVSLTSVHSAYGEGKTKQDRIKAAATKLGDYMKKNKISEVVFDRNNYPYHGRIKQVAEELRNLGITI